MSERSAEPSRRQKLLEFAETGRLRDAVGALDVDAQDLLVDIVMRYCEPRRPLAYRRLLRAKRANAGGAS